MELIDLKALFRAIDDQRSERAMSWAAVGREIGVAPATLMRCQLGGLMEADGVLAMLRWVGKCVSDFAPGTIAHRTDRRPACRRRFDGRSFYAALERERANRGLKWPDVAREIGGTATPDGLRRLSKGGRMSIQQVVRMACWLQRAPETLTRPT